MGEGRIDPEDGEARQQRQWKLQQKAWRFVYETAGHVHSLKLLLFNPVISLPLECTSLRAYLLPTSPFSSSPVVVCQWRSPERGSHRVYVPMPFCLIDHSAPFSAVVCSDHIEVTLKLLAFGESFLDGLSFLGFSHRGVPIKRNVGATQKCDETPFSLASDANLLTRKHSTSIFCRNCSANLIARPLSCIKELPPSDWGELVDRPFGTETVSPSKGVCLVGSTTCTLHPDDLKTGPEAVNERIYVGLATFSGRPAEAGGKLVESQSGVVQSSIYDSTVSDICLEASVGSTYDGAEETLEQAHWANCDSHHEKDALGRDFARQRSPAAVVKRETPTSAFMSGPRAASCSLSWKPFYCHACQRVVGVSSGRKDDGVQLFKCHISTDPCPGVASDIFRYHTLERVFCNELLTNIQGNSSWRYIIIRGLNSKALLLQLIIVNHESWNSSGSCLGELCSISDSERKVASEQEGNGMVLFPECDLMIGVGKEEYPPAFLEPVMTVMFRDGSSFNSKELRTAEAWARKEHACDVYMLEGEVKSLIYSLKGNQRFSPKSCASIDDFKVSFLAR